MILEIKEIININSVKDVLDNFKEMEKFTDAELEEIILSEPEKIIPSITKKAARLDQRYFILLKTNESLLAMHVSLNYFLLIKEDGKQRIEVCLGKQNAQEKFVNYVQQFAKLNNISKSIFNNKEEDINFELCERVAKDLIQHGFEIQIIHSK